MQLFFKSRFLLSFVSLLPLKEQLFALMGVLKVDETKIIQIKE